MTDRFFRLLEKLQKTDRMLRSEQKARFSDPVAIARLRRRKYELRAILARLQPIPARLAAR